MDINFFSSGHATMLVAMLPRLAAFCGAYVFALSFVPFGRFDAISGLKRLGIFIIADGTLTAFAIWIAS